MGGEHDDESWVERDDEAWVERVEPPFESTFEARPDKREPEDEGETVVVPWRELSADALRGVIVEFVTREGTEYGAADVELDTKIAQVRRQLDKGEVAVLWSSKTETVNLATRRELAKLGLSPQG